MVLPFLIQLGCRIVYGHMMVYVGRDHGKRDLYACARCGLMLHDDLNMKGKLQ